jgi:hypothetical protein
MNTQVQWQSAQPLWPTLSIQSDLSPYRRPTILRFATDTFMQDLQAVLQGAPQTLGNYVAAGENWRAPAAGIDAAQGNTLPFKLYQPTHQRFYLIASSLTCRKPGLPDHAVNTSAAESVAFVVRQLRPNTGYTIPNSGNYDCSQVTEYAWIPSTAGVASSTSSNGSSVSNGSSNSGGASNGNNTSASSSNSTSGAASTSGTQPGWMQASFQNTPTALAPGEELIPLSQTQFGSNGSSRRLYIGLIPASRRQQYISGITLPTASSASSGSAGSGSSGSSSSGSGSGSSGSSSATPPDPRMDLFNREVIGPWCNLLDWWTNLDNPLPSGETVSPEQISQMSSALILDDFGTFLSTYLLDVWKVMTGAASYSALTSAEKALYNYLNAAMQTAIVAAQSVDQTLEQAGPDESANWSTTPAYPNPLGLTDPSVSAVKPLNVQTLVQSALPPLSTVSSGTNVTSLPPLAQPPFDSQGICYYIIRCVYLRPQCKCSVFSQPSQQFLLTNYFDSDAPARRIQVALPVDATAAGLRKYDKGVAFMVSDQLRNQMQRVASLNDLSNGNIGSSGGFTLGTICSFSIPIITICAFILLFVIVIALNLVFFWIPFFRICFPIPEES